MEENKRIIKAKNQNEILKRIFSAISDDGFDINLSFADIEPDKLKEFWLYSTGFMCLNNYENELLDEDTIEKMMNGSFNLQALSNSQTQKLIAHLDERVKRIFNNTYSASLMLYKIQDSNYSVIKNRRIQRNGRMIISNQLFLRTNPVELYTDIDNLQMTQEQALAIIRNVLAHSVPEVDGTKVVLSTGLLDFVVPKMWLRGFAETYATIYNIDEHAIIERLSQILLNQHNYFENIKDIDTALSSIKDLFYLDAQDNFFRVSNFIRQRLSYDKNFFSRKPEDKIAELAAMLSNNPIYLSNPYDTMNSAVVYKLQQLIAKNLIDRNIESDMSVEDYQFEEFLDASAKFAVAIDKLSEFSKKNASRKLNSALITQFKQLEKEYEESKKRYDSLNRRIEGRKTLECSHMDLFNPESLKYLTVEVGVNVVCMLAYNNLTTSAFYDELLYGANFDDFNDAQDSFFSKVDLSKFNITFNDYQQKVLYPNDKARAISYIRNALIHGMVKYSLPPTKQNQVPSFKDVTLTFYNKNSYTISGKLIDFYNLFSSNIFTARRPKEIKVSEIEKSLIGELHNNSSNPTTFGED